MSREQGNPLQQVGRQVTPVGMDCTCVGCGCTDLHACEGGCWWLRVDRERGDGVCSNCGGHVEAWDHARQAKGKR